jgi:hypothetical protein
MEDKTGYLIIGAFLAILGIWSAMGAVSLGTINKVTTGGSVQGSYLVYNPIFEMVSILLVALGMMCAYYAAKSTHPALTPTP